jgi:hypothetical protein
VVSKTEQWRGNAVQTTHPWKKASHESNVTSKHGRHNNMPMVTSGPARLPV